MRASRLPSPASKSLKWVSRRTNLTPGVVPIGEGKNLAPMPHVRSTIGHRWLSFNDLVKLRSDGDATITTRIVTEMLEKSGLNVSEFSNLGNHKEHGIRSLYVGLGTDLSSAVLLAACHRWALETKEPLKIQPLMIKLNFIEGHSAIQNVVIDYMRSRSIAVRIVGPSESDFEQVESSFPDRTINWSELTVESEEVKLLVKWMLYSVVKIQERHPFGAHILIGTDLDRHLQKIAAFVTPTDRVRNPNELWGMSMEPATPQLPVIDTCNADWKIGQVKFHKPFLALNSTMVAESATRIGMKSLTKLLSQPPPVSSRLQEHEIATMLDVVSDCHIRVRGMRKIAVDFIKKSCRLDYRLGWCTISVRELAVLPEEAAQLVVAALVAFCSDKFHVDWLKTPPESVSKVIGYLTHKERLPPTPVMDIEGTNVSLVYGVPYNPTLSIEQEVFSFIPTPKEGNVPAVEFPPWETKPDRHKHPPTKCFSKVQYGRWLCQIFTTEELKDKGEKQLLTYYVTRLRPLDDPWWEQVCNAESFIAYLKTEIHQPELASNTQVEKPTRPDKSMLLDIPVILAGRRGLAPPSDDDEPIPEATHLEVVGCPPFGYWAPLLRHHTWQRSTLRVHRCPATLLKPQWLLDFLPSPGMLGPLFIPISRQVQHQLKASTFLRKKKEFSVLPDELTPEQYKRIKTYVVSNVMKSEKGDQQEKGYIDDVFARSKTLLERQGRLTDIQSEVSDDEEAGGSGFETPIWEADDTPDSKENEQLIQEHKHSQQEEVLPKAKKLAQAWMSVSPDNVKLPKVAKPNSKASTSFTRPGPWNLHPRPGDHLINKIPPGVEN
eukprot:TRINITY_DN10586_c0_g3_i1.p1 TRINITY_DN10586_c0_g3~~TRINITY_DN10586_c0_g3_i1.p1  ORF type:complete len:845 (+),score=141.91 TRINITY_DN10586_c0_g3_i1:45-2537(+)